MPQLISWRIYASAGNLECTSLAQQIRGKPDIMGVFCWAMSRMEVNEVTKWEDKNETS